MHANRQERTGVLAASVVLGMRSPLLMWLGKSISVMLNN